LDLDTPTPDCWVTGFGAGATSSSVQSLLSKQQTKSMVLVCARVAMRMESFLDILTTMGCQDLANEELAWKIFSRELRLLTCLFSCWSMMSPGGVAPDVRTRTNQVSAKKARLGQELKGAAFPIEIMNFMDKWVQCGDAFSKK
jgi:hypothetical protein